MKFKREASANWKGTGMEGSGTISTQSTVLDSTQYSFKTRFENGVGTNPEELIGAAHAGCYTMQLSFLMSEAGYTPTNLDTHAKVFFEDGAIPKIELKLEAEVPNLSKEEFLELAEKAKEICPISKLLDTKIELSANLG
ncbi:OsmC family peroxiredoxin [Maribacter sp. 4U21]|uniref:OsmC family protein n=1 Tax=Maribacter sp. 4U21 TaxID=1889779 RepID=UPI000C161BD0|nr:OsmC family protein [Maribacter sp. 4U21]PIB27041.1 OsmC family peroxiredoxin [Maribacter sp. 4U21]